MNYKSQMKLQQHKDAMCQFTESFNPEHFVTLVFRSDISRKQAERSLAGFINRMNRCFFPRRSKKQLRVLPVLEMGIARYTYRSCDIENADVNWHIHLIMENPTKIKDSNVFDMDQVEFKKLMNNLWGGTPHGDEAFTTRHDRADWFQPIYDMKKLTGYLYKETHQNEVAVMYEYANNSGLKKAKSP